MLEVAVGISLVQELTQVIQETLLGSNATQAQSGRGMNFSLLPRTPGYRGTRMHRGFRQDQASIKRDFKNRIRQERKTLRNAGSLMHKEMRLEDVLLNFAVNTEPNVERTLRAFKQNGQQTITLILVAVKGDNGITTEEKKTAELCLVPGWE